jgi:hypothetical protein
MFALLILFGAMALAVYLLLTNFSQSNPNPSTQWPAEVDWPTAIEIIHSGQVSQVIQAHNLEVILTLKDGSQIKTSEPVIDEIFKEIELCGETCSEILLIIE